MALSRFSSPPRPDAGAKSPAFLGAAPSDYWKVILNWIFPQIYQSNWAQSVKLSFDQIGQVIKAAIYFYSLGYAFKDWPSFRAALQKSLPSLPPLEVSKVLSLLSGIDFDKYPIAAEYLRSGKTTAATALKTDLNRLEDKSKYIVEEAADKIKRGAAAIAETANQNLPFYLKPQILIPAAAAAFLYYKFWRKKRRVYQSNPVKGRRAAVEKYTEFHDRQPDKFYSIPAIDTDNLVELGNALEIGYKSKKWTGKNEDYLHEFGRGVKLYATPDGKNLIIRGGKLKLTKHGIEN